MSVPSKIKILFLGANPSTTTHLALGDEVREIMQRLRAAHQGEQFELVQEWAVRVGDLQQALLRHRPQIVHFSGHGRGEGDAFSRSGPISNSDREMLSYEDPRTDEADGAILVEDDTPGKVRPLPASALANLFKIVGGIRCVVLNACHSAVQADAICEHVEAVVSMRRSIHDTAAVNFAWAFYQGLGFGQSLQTAFELGKNQIELAGFGDVDVPHLLTRDMRKSVPPAPVGINEMPNARPIRERPSWRPLEADRQDERVDPFLLHVERVAKLRQYRRLVLARRGPLSIRTWRTRRIPQSPPSRRGPVSPCQTLTSINMYKCLLKHSPDNQGRVITSPAPP